MPEPELNRRGFLSILVAAPLTGYFGDGLFSEFDTLTCEQYPLTTEAIEEFVRATLPNYSRRSWVDISMDAATTLGLRNGNELSPLELDWM